MLKTIYLSLLVCLLSGSVVFAASSDNIEVKPLPGLSDEQEPWQKTARYRSRLRVIEKEYADGAITKTEYIQRKRELDALSR